MNMENNPTIEELRELIRACDDRAGHHVLWLARNGDVHVSRVPKARVAGDFAESLPDMQLRYETFEAGNEYVGPEAAEDSGWITELFDVLTREWARTKGKPEVKYIDQL